MMNWATDFENNLFLFADNTAKVTFTKWTNSSVTASLGSLQLSTLGYTGSATSADKKAKLAAQREYAKKKKAKKAERYKEMEEKTEACKNKWQNFSNKGSCFTVCLF